MKKKFTKLVAIVLTLVITSAMLLTGATAVAAEVNRPTLRRAAVNELKLGDSRETNLGNLELYLTLIDMYGDSRNDDGYYTADSYAPFAEALAVALAVKEDSSKYSDKEIEDILNELLEAWDSLVVDVDGYFTVESLLEYVQQYVNEYGEAAANASEYKAESFAPFEEAYKTLLKIKRSSSDFTKFEIYDALMAMDAAYSELEMEVTAALLKKTADETHENVTKNIGWDDLESAKAFHDACAKAYEVADKANSTTDERETAYNNLVEAYNAWYDEATAIVTAESFKYGDIDSDGKVGMTDVVATQKFIASLIDFSFTEAYAADVDEPLFKITMADVVSMQMYIAELIKLFPVEEVEGDSDTNSDSDVLDTDTSTDSSTDTEKNTDTSTDTSTDTATELDVISLSEVNELGADNTVRTVGQVVYVYGGSTVVLEEVLEDGTVVSLQLYDKTGVAAGSYAINSIVEVTGATSVYNNILQISNPTAVEVISADNTPIAPIEISVTEALDYLGKYCIIRDLSIGVLEGNYLPLTDGEGNTINCYKAPTLPEGMGQGSMVDVVCIPDSYQGTAQIRVADTSDFTVPGTISIDTDTDDVTDTDVASDTDDVTDTDPNANLFRAEPNLCLDDIAGKRVVIAMNGYAMGGLASDSSVGCVAISDSDGVIDAPAECVFVIEEVLVEESDEDVYAFFLYNEATNKYLGKADEGNKSILTDDPTKAVAVTSDDNGNFFIADVNSGRELAGFVPSAQSTLNLPIVFRWYLVGSETQNSRVFTIYLEF